MRIDKFLWSVRLFKTRSMAADACKQGKILVNHQEVKSSKELKVGDVISIKKNTALFSYKVLDLLSSRVGAPLVKNFIEDISPESEKRKYEEYQSAQREFRDFSFGKPSKQDRRKLRRFLGD